MGKFTLSGTDQQARTDPLISPRKKVIIRPENRCSSDMKDKGRKIGGHRKPTKQSARPLNAGGSRNGLHRAASKLPRGFSFFIFPQMEMCKPSAFDWGGRTRPAPSWEEVESLWSWSRRGGGSHENNGQLGQAGWGREPSLLSPPRLGRAEDPEERPTLAATRPSPNCAQA